MSSPLDDNAVRTGRVCFVGVPRSSDVSMIDKYLLMNKLDAVSFPFHLSTPSPLSPNSIPLGLQEDLAGSF